MTLFPWLRFKVNKSSGEGRCGACEHFDDDPLRLEANLPGVNSLSSVRGSSRGDAGICHFHNLYLLPVHSCPDFRHK
jgi:hypothetical protein